MRRVWSLCLTALILAGCGSRLSDTGPGASSAQDAAERALDALENGEEVPLPGFEGGLDDLGLPAETDIGSEVVSEAARAAAARLNYEVRPGWFMVDTSLVFPGSTAPEKARQKVLSTARAAGLEQALPKETSFTSLLSDVMDEAAGVAFEKSTWSTFALSSVTGHLVDEKILSANLEQMAGDAYRYRIILEARIVPVKGDRNPSLSLELDVNERLLTAGDELIVRVRSSRDGYLYLFNFLNDNSVMLMYPHAQLGDQTITAGRWLEIPTPQERAGGIHFHVAVAPGLSTSNETIYAVFTRQPIADLSSLISVREGYATFSAGDESFTTFQRRLWEIPLDQRTEQAVQLHIINEME